MKPIRLNTNLSSALLVAAILFSSFSVMGSTATFAQAVPPPIWQVRTMAADQTGINQPIGLVFSSKRNAFYALDAKGWKRTSPTTDFIEITPSEKRAGAARIAAALQDPINMAYDNQANRLLILQAQGNQLLEVLADQTGKLDPATLTRHNVVYFGVQNAQGLTVDPVSGDLFILDAAGPRIVRVSGGLDSGTVSVVDLRSSGIDTPRGIAFDPSTRHLNVVSRSKKKLYELTQIGEVLAARDLSQFNLKDMQGMVFAPSGDQTDDASQMSLYLADTGLTSSSIAPAQTNATPATDAQSTGQIVELSLAATVEAAAANFTSSLVRTTNMAAISPPSPDPSGITYLPTSNTLLIVDGEVEETVNGITHFQGANVWELTLLGSKVRTANISTRAPTVTPMTNEPTGVTWNPSDGHYFVTDDNAKRVYNLNPGGDGLIGTADDSWTSFSTTGAGNGDPEGIAFDTWNNRLFVADGVNREVYQYSLTGTLINHFDVATYGVQDPESVEFNPDSGTLFVMSSNSATPIIVETTLSGALLQTINISATQAPASAGLAYAPASNGSGVRRFYIVDRGIDNNDNPKIIDGKMYEMTAPASGPTATPTKTPTSTNTSTPTSTFTPTNTPTDTPTPTATSTATNTPTSTDTSAPTSTFTPTNTPTLGPTPPDTPTPTATFTATNTPTPTETNTPGPTSTPTPTFTPSPTSAVSDLIFADGFESGNFSAWSSATTGGGDLSVSAAAALLGSKGMQVLINDTTSIYVSDTTPNAEPRYRARFYFDPNSISMTDGNAHYIFMGIAPDTTSPFQLDFRFSGGNYQIRLRQKDDSALQTSTAWVTISDASHIIEMEWWAATAAGGNNGGVNLWIDDVPSGSLDSLDNDTERIDTVRLGAVTALDAGTLGTYYIDAFESRRETYIGP